jgi:hypothetical protein
MQQLMHADAAIRLFLILKNADNDDHDVKLGLINCGNLGMLIIMMKMMLMLIKPISHYQMANYDDENAKLWLLYC